MKRSQSKLFKKGSVQESGEVANWRGFERLGPGGWLLRLASLAASPNLLAMSAGKWCGSGGERGVYPRGA
jgi:hypothetical protein